MGLYTDSVGNSSYLDAMNKSQDAVIMITLLWHPSRDASRRET